MKKIISGSIWDNCTNCKVNCCRKFESHKIYLTPSEKKKLKHINKTFPCFYLNKEGGAPSTTIGLSIVDFGLLI